MDENRAIQIAIWQAFDRIVRSINPRVNKNPGPGTGVDMRLIAQEFTRLMEEFGYKIQPINQ
jgi:hypothetical protein